MNNINQQRLDAMNDAMYVLEIYSLGKVRCTEGKKPAIVFDIDDTLIDSESGKIILPMLLLYRNIEKAGIPIFIITARSHQYIIETKEELRKHGITGYKELFMVDHDLRVISNYPKTYVEDKAMRKAKARKYIENHGYDVLLNLGDDPGDMMHGHYMYGIKLPYLY